MASSDQAEDLDGMTSNAEALDERVPEKGLLSRGVDAVKQAWAQRTEKKTELWKGTRKL